MSGYCKLSIGNTCTFTGKAYDRWVSADEQCSPEISSDYFYSVLDNLETNEERNAFRELMFQSSRYTEPMDTWCRANPIHFIKSNKHFKEMWNNTIEAAQAIGLADDKKAALSKYKMYLEVLADELVQQDIIEEINNDIFQQLNAVLGCCLPPNDPWMKGTDYYKTWEKFSR